LGLAFTQSIQNGGEFAHRASEPVPEQAKSPQAVCLVGGQTGSVDYSELGFNYNPFPKINRSMEAAFAIWEN